MPWTLHTNAGTFRLPRLALLLALLAFLCIVTAFFLVRSYRGEIAEASTLARGRAELLGVHLEASIRLADATLRRVRSEIARRPGLPPNDPEMRRFLRQALAELPYARALFVIGIDGFVAHDTDYPETPHTNLADRNYFSVFAADPADRLFVGHALFSRSVERWFIPLSRPVRDETGTPRGVAVVALEPGVFEDVYRRFHAGPGEAVALLHASGTLLVRAPALPDLYGKSVTGLRDLRRVSDRPAHGVFRAADLAGEEAVIGYASVASFPVTVLASIDLAHVVADWRRMAIFVGAGTLLAAALLVWLFVMMERRAFERRREFQRHLFGQKLEELGQMTGTIAHDFNNILAAVAGGVHMLRKKGPSEDLLGALEQSLDRGSRLTSQLLSFAKRRAAEPQLAGLDDMLRAIESMCRYAAGPNAGPELAYGAADKKCMVDAAQFDAAVINLVKNAAQSMPGGGPIRVATEIQQFAGDRRLAPGRYGVLSVTDRGSGIPPEHLEKIFRPFFSTKQERGTGLGLAQVRDFARQAGGDVRVESRLNVGTRFELWLPCVQEPVQETRSAVRATA